MINKPVKIIISALVLIIAAEITMIYFIQSKKQALAPQQNTPNPSRQPELYSLNGTVNSVDATGISLLLLDGKTIKTFKTGPSTIVDRLQTSTSGASLVNDKYSSIVQGSKIVIYSKTDPTSSIQSQIIKITLLK
jgi:hypothetical protein